MGRFPSGLRPAVRAVLVLGLVLGPAARPLPAAGDRELENLLSGLPTLPEKAFELFPFDRRFSSADLAALPLSVFFSLMSKPEMLDVNLFPLVPQDVLDRTVGIEINQATKGEVLGLVLQVHQLRAAQFNERTVIIVPITDPRGFGRRTKKIYRLTYTTPDAVTQFLSANRSLTGILNPQNVIAHAAGQSILVIDTPQAIAVMDAVINLLDAKPNKIQAQIRLSFLDQGEFSSAIGALGPDVQQRINPANIYYSPEGRSLIVYDTPENVEFLRNVVRKIDLAPKQVLIDTAIMTVQSQFTRELGIRLTSQGFTVDSLDRLLNQQRLNRHLNDTGQLTASAQITYLLQRNGAQTLASPKIRTLDGERAQIQIGDIIVVQIVSQTAQQPVGGGQQISQNVTPQEVNTGVQLSVQPMVHHDRTVTLDLTISNDQPTQVLPFGVNRSTANSTTKLRVKDGETIILGGFINKNNAYDKTPVPILGEIPFLRSIFNVNRRDKRNQELVFLLTPYILEYVVNEETGEAELPTDPEQITSRDGPVNLRIAALDKKPKTSLRDDPPVRLRDAKTGEPVVRHLYASGGRTITVHEPGDPGAEGGGARSVAGAAGPAGPAGLAAPSQPSAPARETPDVPLPTMARGEPGDSPVFTFKPEGTADARLGAPPAWAGGAGDSDTAGAAAGDGSRTGDSSPWPTLPGETPGGAGASDARPGPPGTVTGPLPGTSTGSLRRLRVPSPPAPSRPVATPAGPAGPAGPPDPALLREFENAVRDAADWKQSVVTSRQTRDPERMTAYGVLGDFKDSVKQAQAFQSTLPALRPATPDPGFHPGAGAGARPTGQRPPVRGRQRGTSKGLAGSPATGTMPGREPRQGWPSARGASPAMADSPLAAPGDFPLEIPVERIGPAGSPPGHDPGRTDPVSSAPAGSGSRPVSSGSGRSEGASRRDPTEDRPSLALRHRRPSTGGGPGLSPRSGRPAPALPALGELAGGPESRTVGPSPLTATAAGPAPAPGRASRFSSVIGRLRSFVTGRTGDRPGTPRSAAPSPGTNSPPLREAPNQLALEEGPQGAGPSLGALPGSGRGERPDGSSWSPPATAALPARDEVVSGETIVRPVPSRRRQERSSTLSRDLAGSDPHPHPHPPGPSGKRNGATPPGPPPRPGEPVPPDLPRELADRPDLVERIASWQGSHEAGAPAGGATPGTAPGTAPGTVPGPEPGAWDAGPGVSGRFVLRRRPPERDHGPDPRVDGAPDAPVSDTVVSIPRTVRGPDRGLAPRDLQGPRRPGLPRPDRDPDPPTPGTPQSDTVARPVGGSAAGGGSSTARPDATSAGGIGGRARAGSRSRGGPPPQNLSSSTEWRGGMPLPGPPGDPDPDPDGVDAGRLARLVRPRADPAARASAGRRVEAALGRFLGRGRDVEDSETIVTEVRQTRPEPEPSLVTDLGPMRPRASATRVTEVRPDRSGLEDLRVREVPRTMSRYLPPREAAGPVRGMVGRIGDEPYGAPGRIPEDSRDRPGDRAAGSPRSPADALPESQDAVGSPESTEGPPGARRPAIPGPRGSDPAAPRSHPGASGSHPTPRPDPLADGDRRAVPDPRGPVPGTTADPVAPPAPALRERPVGTPAGEPAPTPATPLPSGPAETAPAPGDDREGDRVRTPGAATSWKHAWRDLRRQADFGPSPQTPRPPRRVPPPPPARPRDPRGEPGSDTGTGTARATGTGAPRGETRSGEIGAEIGTGTSRDGDIGTGTHRETGTATGTPSHRSGPSHPGVDPASLAPGPSRSSPGRAPGRSVLYAPRPTAPAAGDGSGPHSGTGSPPTPGGGSDEAARESGPGRWNQILSRIRTRRPDPPAVAGSSDGPAPARDERDETVGPIRSSADENSRSADGRPARGRGSAGRDRGGPPPRARQSADRGREIETRSGSSVRAEEPGRGRPGRQASPGSRGEGPEPGPGGPSRDVARTMDGAGAVGSVTAGPAMATPSNAGESWLERERRLARERRERIAEQAAGGGRDDPRSDPRRAPGGPGDMIRGSGGVGDHLHGGEPLERASRRPAPSPASLAGRLGGSLGAPAAAPRGGGVFTRSDQELAPGSPRSRDAREGTPRYAAESESWDDLIGELEEELGGGR